uniref:Phospholipase B-like n=1 Tax=Cuerna arida TaxID=1464854 RepID=A0A1B6G302_9HEMI
MLKVVGASWLQTRITLFTLAAVTVVGLLTYYYGGVIPSSHDGNYAATVYWSRTTGFRLHFWGQNNEPAAVRKGVARAYYRPDMTKDGWASIEIETLDSYPDTVQAHAAGLLEGSLSWQLIYYHWKNTIERTCEDRQDFCEQARIILDQNTVNIREQAKSLDEVDPFWHQINLFYEQLDGIEVGWRYAVDRSRKDFDIPHQDFLWMNMACDLRDLELMYNSSLENNPHRPLSMALLKIDPGDSTQFLLAHASSSFYSAMLRVQKRYHFGFHMTGRSGTRVVVPGQVVVFTSYPGTIHSQDDFYQVSGTGTPLTVSGTAIKNLNPSLWAQAEVTTQVFMGPRVMAANRVAHNGSHWTKLVSKSYSGTGNKQWLVVQSAGVGSPGVRLWVTEQVPGLTHSEEQTKRLNKTGYWASSGMPFYRDILNMSGNIMSAYQLSNPVAEVLSMGQANVTDLASLVELMRSPDLTLVGRSDLSLDDIHQLELEYQSRFLRSTTEQDMTNEIIDSRENQDNDQEKITPPHFVHNVRELFNTIISKKKLSEELRQMEDNNNDTSEEIRVAEEMPEIDSIISKRKVLDTDESKILPLREFSGVIDLKVSKNDGFLAAAGPPFSVDHGAVVVQPFQWSKSLIKDLPHVGQADVWNFGPVEPKWVWN